MNRGLVAGLALILGAVEMPRTASGQTIESPRESGHQLIFLYDARADRRTFMSVTNPSNEAVVLDVAFYSAGSLALIVRETITLASQGNQVIDSISFGGGTADGSFGITVVTPVVSAEDLQAVVPPEPLVGVFTFANLNLGSGFGENPFGRLAVDDDGLVAAPGTVVDGETASYERFDPEALIIPTYFDPATLAPPEIDGNRILLATFADEYEVPFGISYPAGPEATAIFFNNAGVEVDRTDVEWQGVFVTNLQALAGTDLNGASGKVFFEIEPNDDNTIGLFSQSVGTFAAGQRMPAVEIPLIPIED